MTDRELLEMAAKAVGYETSHRWNRERMQLSPPVIALCIPGVSTGWNPLADDGDALRLAVRLGISIDPQESAVCAIARGHVVIEQGVGSLLIVATRRAIVRAAAEIGKEAS